jgi:hypothetical protein
MNALIQHVPSAGFSTLPDRRCTTRVAAGIAISLALHALLLSSYRQPSAPPAAPVPASETLTVRLQAPETPAATPAAPAVQEEPRAEAPTKPVPRTRTLTPRRIIAVPPKAAPDDEKKLKVETPPADAVSSPAPHFNLDAAREVARKVAKEPDPARVGTALERLPPPPLQTETKLERAIKAAKRPDCKDGVPGGLLAPIYLAMDKKDSGCKW